MSKKNLKIFTLFTIILTSCENINFDSKKWKNYEARGPEISLRWDMSEDLINNYNLKGKDSSEIFALLGRENLDCYKDECIIRYTLGPCHRGISYGTLELTLKKGKVRRIFKHCN